MSDLFYRCTRDDAMRQQGLLGQGTLPYPEVIANRVIPRIDVSGEYATDEFSGAMVLAANLAEPDDETTPEEAQEDLGLLVRLYAKAKEKGTASAAELEALRNRAEAIPVVGPLLFSHANLPGTLASVGGMIHATAQTKRVTDLLKVSSSIKREIIAWSTDRARGVNRPLNRAARKRVKVIYQNNRLVLKIPASTLAPFYNLGSLSTGRHINVPATGARELLNSRVGPNPHTYSTRGVGRILLGNVAGGVLTFGPQAIMDASQSSSISDFAHRSAYSQPTNVVAFAAGAAATAALTAAAAPAVIVIVAALGAGVVVQMIMKETGFDQSLGDALSGK